MENYSIPQSYEFSRFLQFLIKKSSEENDRLPSLAELSRLLNISQPALREQLEQAKTLGLVTAKPKLGIRRIPYNFSSAAQESIKYAIHLDQKYFSQLSEMRKALEKAFWYESITKLNDEDCKILLSQIKTAQEKLIREPAEIPHLEHKTLHMTVFRHLDNTFVKGILEGFWFAYEVIGMNQFSNVDYLRKVWNYHSRIINAIIESDFDLSYRLLIEHFELIQNREQKAQKYSFE